MVQIAPGKIEGKALTVVAGHGYLPFELSFCGIKLLGAEGLLHHLVELAGHKAAAARGVAVVAAIIQAPHTGVGIAHHGTLDRIYQSTTLAQGNVEAGVHGRSTKHVIEQIERHAVLIVGRKCPAA